jgi:hypothetical protein
VDRGSLRAYLFGIARNKVEFLIHMYQKKEN